MSDEASENATEEVKENVASEEPKPLAENPPAETKPVSQTVKVDLSEFRELLEGLPEKTAQFIKEAVTTPKRSTAQKSEPKKVENAPQDTSNDTPKPHAESKRGWLANVLFGK